MDEKKQNIFLELEISSHFWYNQSTESSFNWENQMKKLKINVSIYKEWTGVTLQLKCAENIYWIREALKKNKHILEVLKKEY